MGCGKTSVGIRLSYRIRRTMIDTDKMIERLQKMTVSEIFDRMERKNSVNGNAVSGAVAGRVGGTDYIGRRRTAHAGENRKLLKQLEQLFILGNSADRM